ncbi:MAG: hypothetical protein IJJ01_02475 [Firmicutes bacterium]|nr:hypothetical protein [Bacillota bacterium]
MDSIYEELIDGIPEDITADSVAMGPSWMLVIASCGCGAASVYDEGNHPTGCIPKYEGKTLRELGRLIDSPNMAEQGISVAAINAYYNQMERLWEMEAESKIIIDTTSNSFVEYGQLVNGKDVTFVGHFCGLEQHMTKAGSVSILEKRPQPGDIPAEKCDEVIPGMDYVFMTGATLANGTASHLLELCNQEDHTKAIFIGPTTTMSEVLIDHGAAELSGMVITDSEAALNAVVSGDHKAIFSTGQKLRVIACRDSE